LRNERDEIDKKLVQLNENLEKMKQGYLS
jgi:hypothetical protein